MRSYEDIIAAKAHAPTFAGLGVREADIAGHLFAHQRDLTRWSLRRGRSAIFADTGLGKGLMAAEWARNVTADGRVLILAPLAVGPQLSREAARFGVDAPYVRSDNGAPIVITNYELLHQFDPSKFVGVVLDESSILKAFDGKTRNQLIEAFRDTPYKLACTATPAPNDFTELGNHSEFLGLKTRIEMLAEFFVHDGGSTQDWRLKGHAVKPFWRWLATWGAVVKKPSDLGYSDDGFELPALRMHEHVIHAEHDPSATGLLFAMEAKTLSEQRAVRRSTIENRARMAADLVGNDEPAIVWCELNDEADAVAELLADRGGIQVAGNDKTEIKEQRLLGFAEGRHRVLVSKPSICGFGLNWQHCGRQVFIGASHSYEQTYQAIRRSWRFGRRDPVDVHIIRADTESAIVANYRRKEEDANQMAVEMTAMVGDAVKAEVRGLAREFNPYEPSVPMQVPSWLTSEAA